MRKLTEKQKNLLHRLYDGRMAISEMSYEHRRRADTLISRGLVRARKEKVEHLGKRWETIFYNVTAKGIDIIRGNPPSGWTWGRRGLRQLGVYDG